MKAMLIKTAQGLRGATAEDDEAWRRFKRRLKTLQPGKWLRIEASSPRNGKHHRKLFALLKLVAENSEIYDTTEKALVAIKLVSGHFETAIHPETGEVIQITKTINYESMDQEEFDKFYSAAIDGVLQYILPTMDRGSADRLMDDIVSGWA